MAARRTLAMFLGALVISAGLFVGSPPAGAVTQCTGAISNQTINDDLNVPAGAFCVLNGVTVNGNISVAAGGGLGMTDSLVTGNVAGYQAVIVIFRSTVRGNVVSLSPPNTVFDVAFTLCGSTVGGSVTVRNGSGSDSITVGGFRCGAESQRSNTIGGSLTVANNVVSTGGIEIHQNRISGILYCANNTPPPNGGNNTAAAKYGQCTNL